MELTKNEVLAIGLLSDAGAGIYVKALIKNKNEEKKTNRIKNKSSKFKGVHWNKSKGKWKAEITIKGNRKYLGLFTNEEEANEAYKKALKDDPNNWEVDEKYLKSHTK